MNDAAPRHVSFGLRAIAPVVEATAERKGEGGRHVNQHVPPGVGAAGFENQNAASWVGADAIREHAARRATADDHEGQMPASLERITGLLGRFEPSQDMIAKHHRLVESA